MMGTKAGSNDALHRQISKYWGLRMSSPDSDSPVNVAIAMVATSSTKLPDASRIVAASGVKTAGTRRFLGSLFGQKAPVSKEHEWQDSNLVFSLRDAQLAVSLMPLPIPWSELEGPCATAWWWPEATQALQSHTSHFLIALVGGSIEPVERRVTLTKVVSAVVRHSDAVGVYWGEGTLVHDPKEFVRQAKSASDRNIPGMLWLDVRVEQNPDGSFRCFTTGMAPLGFLEIEVEKSDLPPDELMGFVGDTACYIVNSRLQIPDGDTMGRSATEQYKVVHGASMFDRPKVMQLVMK
jgi:hypothetical protein